MTRLRLMIGWEDTARPATIYESSQHTEQELQREKMGWGLLPAPPSSSIRDPVHRLLESPPSGVPYHVLSS